MASSEPTALLYTNAFALFSAESSRGLFISSLFTYIATSASQDDARDWIGYAVSAFSIGRLASSFALPLLLECGFSYSAILVFTNVLQIVGHVLYVLPSAALHRGDLAVVTIIAARALVGFGSGSLPTCRAVVAQVTTTQRRAFHFSVLSFFKYVGYALVPGLSIAWAKADFALSRSVRLSNTTMPAFLAVLLSAASLVLIVVFFDHGLKGARGGAAAAAPAQTSQLMSSPPASSALELAASSASLNARSAAEESAHTRAASAPCRLATEVFLGKPQGSPPAARLLFRALQLFVVLNLVTKASLAVAETTIAVQFSQAIASSVPHADLAFDTAAYVFALGLFGLTAYLGMALRPPPLTKSEASEARSGRRFSCLRTHASTIEKALLLVALILTGVGSLACIPIASLSRNLVLADLSFGMVLVWSIAGPVLDILTVSSYSVLVSEVGSGGSQARDMAAISAAGSIGRISLPSLLGSLTLSGTWLLSAVLSFVAAAMAAHFYMALPSFLKLIDAERRGEGPSFLKIIDAERRGEGGGRVESSGEDASVRRGFFGSALSLISLGRIHSRAVSSGEETLLGSFYGSTGSLVSMDLSHHSGEHGLHPINVER